MSLQRLRRDHGDTDREKRFLAAHAAMHDRIYAYFRRRTANAAAAEDLCAEVFRIAWEKSAAADSLTVMVMFGVARNVLRNHYRSVARAGDLILALHAERPEIPEGVDSPVHEALEQLSPDDKEVLLLTYWDGFTSSEVSNLLNTSATAVRMRLHRARKALGLLLQEQPEPQPEGARS